MKEITLGIEILDSYKSMNEEELDKQLLECVEKNEKKIIVLEYKQYMMCLYIQTGQKRVFVKALMTLESCSIY